MSTMQIVFSISGLMLIAAIIGHGMWTIRRNDKRQRAQAEAIDQKRRQAGESGTGFSDEGVGPVRVVKKHAATASQSKSTPPEATTMRANDEPEIDMPELKADPEDAPVTRTSEPQPAPAPEVAPTQQSMDLPVEADEDEPVLTEEPEEVIVLHVIGDIQGAILLQQMTELGFKFGEFDIFHRHVDTAGNGPVLFSLANMFNPGSFDIDRIETFQTEGVALFLALPIKGDSKQAFTMMHNAASKLAAAVNHGQVMDEHRNPLTRQAAQHIHQRIREFERKRLIKQP